MSLATLQGGRGISFDDYFKQALNLDVSKLEAIIRGQDHSMPIVAAMAAYEVKKPMATAAAGQQATQQLQQAHPTVRQEMEQQMQQTPMIPDMAMLQQQRMGPQPPVQPPPQGGLPEQGGVGALPAPNMEGMSMAHGGIIAFDDGGEVETYADGNLVGQGLRREPMLPPPKRSMSSMFKEKELELGEQGVQEEIAKLQAQLLSLPPGPQRDYVEQRLNYLSGKTPREIPQENMMGGKTPAQMKTAGKELDAMLAAQPEFTTVPSRSAGAPAAPRSGARPAGIAAAVPTAPAPETESAGIQSALDAQQAISEPANAQIRGMMNKYERDVATGIEGLRAERERGKPAGEAYSKLEASLQKEEGEAAGKEERNLRMALVNAGLAIAGGTSRYALENIGKGALVGTKQYMDGIDKLEAAAKKRQEAMAMVEQARRAEARDDYKAKNEFESKAFELQTGAKKSSIDALAKIYDTDKRGATDIFNNMQNNKRAMDVAQLQEKSAKERAIIGKEAALGSAEIYSKARGGSPQNIAEDNAKARFDSWLKTVEGKTAGLKPGAADAKYKEFLRDAYANMGLPPPASLGAGASPGAGGSMFDYTPGKGLVPVR